MWQLLGLVIATINPAAYGYQSLHIVDLEEVICPGGKQYVDISLDNAQLLGANGYNPHIVTFLRSSNQETNITFQLLQTGTDGTLTPTGVGDTVQLAYLAGQRRLAGADTAHQEQGRRLSARRRGGGGFSSSRSRSSSSSSYSSSRSRSTAPRPSPPRRRSMNANSPAARRRGGTTMASGTRRRSTAAAAPGAPATHNRFQTTSGSGYGYTSQSAMTNNYGGRYPAASPSYGYSGMSSYGPGKSYSTGTIAAAALGGAVVGAGTYYMFSRMSRASCYGYDCCYDCRNSCYGNGRSSCDVQLDQPLYRDDIMKSEQGFYPSDYTTPLTLRISQISGVGYNTSSVCPPKGWNASQQNASQPYPAINDLFVTLTKMEELGDPADATAVSSAQASQNLDIIMFGLALSMVRVIMRFGQ